MMIRKGSDEFEYAGEEDVEHEVERGCVVEVVGCKVS